MSTKEYEYEARCHCGSIGFRFTSSQDAQLWEIRACQCSFCRVHGARTTTDPHGTVTFQIKNERLLNRYRFGTKSADYYICRQCGVYLAAVLTHDSGEFATINVNTIHPPIQLAETIPASYDGETRSEKVARRQRRWTPVTRTT